MVIRESLWRAVSLLANLSLYFLNESTYETEMLNFATRLFSAL